MDYTVHGKQITLWEGKNYIGTITINHKKQEFKLSLSGMRDIFKFNKLWKLRRYIDTYCCANINITKNIYEYLESIFVMWELTK